MDIILGLLGAILGVLLFVSGYLFQRIVSANTVAKPSPLTEEQERDRRELIETQEAFRNQMEYSASVAYGIGKNDYV